MSLIPGNCRQHFKHFVAMGEGERLAMRAYDVGDYGLNTSFIAPVNIASVYAHCESLIFHQHAGYGSHASPKRWHNLREKLGAMPSFRVSPSGAADRNLKAVVSYIRDVP